MKVSFIPIAALLVCLSSGHAIAELQTREWEELESKWKENFTKTDLLLQSMVKGIFPKQIDDIAATPGSGAVKQIEALIGMDVSPYLENKVETQLPSGHLPAS